MYKIGSFQNSNSTYALRCNDMSCSAHQADIDHFYYDIVNTIHGCIRKCIPIKKRNEHTIVGWNDEIRQYHGIARSEYQFWKQNTYMSRSGPHRACTFRTCSKTVSIR